MHSSSHRSIARHAAATEASLAEWVPRGSWGETGHHSTWLLYCSGYPCGRVTVPTGILATKHNRWCQRTFLAATGMGSAGARHIQPLQETINASRESNNTGWYSPPEPPTQGHLQKIQLFITPVTNIVPAQLCSPWQQLWLTMGVGVGGCGPVGRGGPWGAWGMRWGCWWGGLQQHGQPQ